MVACGDADALVTGTTRSYSVSLDDIAQAIGPLPGSRAFGITMLLSRGKTVFIADTTVHELPSAEELADIAVQAAAKARQMDRSRASRSSPSRISATRCASAPSACATP